MNYIKFKKDEIIIQGDIVSIIPHTNMITKTLRGKNAKHVLGIYNGTNDQGNIEIISSGITDINVEGFIGGLGTILTISNIEAGKAHQIPQDILEAKQYNLPIIGKVVGIYDVYDTVKVLLDNRIFIKEG